MTEKSASRGTAAALGVSNRALDLLRSLITQVMGVDYSGSRESLLEDKLVEVATRRGVRSHLDLYYLLRYDERQEELWSEVADELSVPETYFWRQPEQILALADAVARRPASGKRYRIWSAACCTGEEPLSVAIALDDAGVSLERVEIIGSDASPRMLERARTGVYPERSLRRLPPEVRARHFARVENGWQIDPRLHRAVRWVRANLVDAPEIQEMASADAVLCRNVFIYFTEEAVRNVIATLERAMPEDGLLFLGSAESLARVPTRFQLREINGAFVYRKSEAHGTAAEAPKAPLNRRAAGG